MAVEERELLVHPGVNKATVIFTCLHGYTANGGDVDICHARKLLSGIHRLQANGFPLKACGNDKSKVQF